VAICVVVADPAPVNVVLVVVAGTVTEGGTVSAALLDPNVTLSPPVGAALVSVTVQVVFDPDTMLDGLQDTADTAGGGGVVVTVTVVVLEAPPPVAVTVAICVVVVDPAPVNVVLVVVAGTVTEGGTVRAALLDPNVTLSPPAGAALVSVTVQVVFDPVTMLAGLHDNVDTAGGENPPADLNAAIWARYRSALLKVNVDATGPAAGCTISSNAVSMLLREARNVKPVPAVIVPNSPESSITAPKSRSPAVVVVAAVLVMAFAVVVPAALFCATTSSGEVVATPLYSAIRMRRYPSEAPRFTVTVFAPARLFAA